MAAPERRISATTAESRARSPAKRSRAPVPDAAPRAIIARPPPARRAPRWSSWPWRGLRVGADEDEMPARQRAATERRIAASRAGSRSLVALSRSRTSGRASTARASARRWRWPPDSDAPRSPSSVSKPSGRATMNSAAWTSSAASSSSAALACGRASRRFASTVPPSRNGACSTRSTRRRSCSPCQPVSDRPQSRTAPCTGARRPPSAAAACSCRSRRDRARARRRPAAAASRRRGGPAGRGN